MLKAFINGVSDQTRESLRDPKLPLPFANLQLKPRVIKSHCIAGGDCAPLSPR